MITFFFYSDKLLYINLIYLFLRLKIFLQFAFFYRKREKLGFLFSHFEIIKFFNLITMHIYFYSNRFNSFSVKFDKKF